MNKLSSVWSFICHHKYLITSLAFLVIVGFLDENSIWHRVQYYNEKRVLNNEIEKYTKEKAESLRQLDELDQDSGSIERIAREKYLMKKPDEDIYVFEKDIAK